MKIGWVPLLIMVVAQGAALALVVPALVTAANEQGSFDAQDDAATSAYMGEMAGDLLQQFGWLGVIMVLATMAAYVMLTTGWLRHVLRGSELSGSIGFFRFGKRELKTLSTSLLMGLAVSALGLVVILLSSVFSFGVGAGILSVLISFVLYFVVALVFVRLVLVFPMVALDQGMGWRTVWQISKGNSWRLFWVYCLVSLLVGVLSFVAMMPVGMVMGVFGAVSPQSGVEPASLAVGMIIPMVMCDVIYVAGFMIFLGSLAETYRQLSGPGLAVSEEVLAVFDD